MSKYIIGRDESAKLVVTYEGASIPMVPMLELATPLYSYGNHSDGSNNLAYIILLHSHDKATAEILHADIVGHFLLRQKALPFEIDEESLAAHVSMALKAGLAAQRLGDDMLGKE